MLEYHVFARRIDSHGSEATTKQARIALDMDMTGRPDPFTPAEMIRISYENTVDTDETDARLALLHKNLQKYDTNYDTLAGATELVGTVARKGA